MTSYERMILEELPGTPREQYEYLMDLQKKNIELYSKVEQAKTLLRGLLQTPGLESIHSVLTANYHTIAGEEWKDA